MAVASGAEMVVITNVEAPGLSGFTIRIGYRRPLHRSASGRILLAFQSINARSLMLDAVRATGDTVDDAMLQTQIDAILREGGGVTPIPVLTGITDLSVPILVRNSARAALTVPFVDGPGSRVPLAENPCRSERCRREYRPATRSRSG